MRLLRLISLGWILATTCATNALAQDATPPLAKPDRTGAIAVADALPEYVLEVTRPQGCVTSPISPKGKRGCVLYALPRPAKVPPDSAGQPVTSKVFVVATQENDLWRVRVTIGTGEFYDAGDHQVAEVKLNVNERITVPEVSRFGLTPLRVGVMKIVRQPAGKPQLTNFTQAISVESLEVSDLPDPFKLTLKNNSAQDLVAIQYNTFGSRGFLDLKWLSAGLLKPLTKAGATYKLKVNSEDNSCSAGEGYRPNQLQTIHIVSAVFADGTYEGQTGLPALIKGLALGNRKNLQPVVESIAYLSDPAELERHLDLLQQGMNEEVEPYLVETLRGMFPTIPADATQVLINYIRSGMHEVKTNLARDVQHLRALGRQNNRAFTTRGVDTIKAKYDRWWTAAQNMTSH